MLSISSLAPSSVLVAPPPPPHVSGGSPAPPPQWGLDPRLIPLAQRLNGTLQEVLKELDLPVTLEETTPRQGVNHSDMCLCVLGSALPYISLLLEAGQRSPGDALLCLSPSWLSSPASSSSLLVHKAVTFDLGGRTSLATFDPPRQVTYFLSCDPYMGAEQEVTRGLGCPMGSSGALNRFWSDVLNSRVLMQKASIPTPRTLALLLPSGGQSQTESLAPSGDQTVEVVHLVTTETEQQLDTIRTKMDDFLESEPVKKTERVVLRLSGGRFAEPHHQGAVQFVERSSREELWSRLVPLIHRLHPGEAVLLEAFCPGLKPGARVESSAWDQCTDPEVEKVAFRVSAIVTRSPQDVPLLYKLVCRVGQGDSPLSSSQSVVQSLESCLSALGLRDPQLPVTLRRLAARTALDALRVVMETEDNMSPQERGGAGAQSDMMGVDLLFTVEDSVIRAVVLGLHPSLCLRSSLLPPAGGVVVQEEERWDSETEAERGTLLLTPLVRSQRFLMENKTVLVVGAGSYSKKFIWEAAGHYSIKLLLVDGDPNHFASKMVDHFLPLPDLPDHRRDDQHCARICDWLASAGLRPDGCVCFWDDCVVLTSLVCDRLGLRGPPPHAVCIAKEKSCTHLHLQGLSSRGQHPGEGILKSSSHHLPVSAQEPGGQADSQADMRTMKSMKSVTSSMEADSLKLLADFQLFNNAALEGKTPDPPAPPPPPTSSTSGSSGSFRPSVPLLSPSPGCYAVPCVHVESAVDLQKAQGSVRYPAIMKLEYGAGAVGVRKVFSLEESLAHLERIGGDLREETDYPGIGLGWGNAMTLMEFLGGTEHDVDLVLFEGRLEGAFVSDNGPTRAPAFTETAAQMPSGLAADRRGQLVAAAHHACLGCGLRHGVFNVELKMTAAGPRLIEINARMGGFYLRDWIRQLYGVDLLLAAFSVACGVRPRLPSAAALPHRGHFCGVMCVVSQHLAALRTTASPARLRRLHQEGALWLNELAADDELIAGEYEEPFLNVGVRDPRSGSHARQRLLALCQGLGLHCPPRYDLTHFLSHFS